jgi:hypothetical protein
MSPLLRDGWRLSCAAGLSASAQTFWARWHAVEHVEDLVARARRDRLAVVNALHEPCLERLNVAHGDALQRGAAEGEQEVHPDDRPGSPQPSRPCGPVRRRCSAGTRSRRRRTSRPCEPCRAMFRGGPRQGWSAASPRRGASSGSRPAVARAWSRRGRASSESGDRPASGTSRTSKDRAIARRERHDPSERGSRRSRHQRTLPGHILGT